MILGANRYGKAETHVVRVNRNGSTHEIRDLNVSVALSGEMEAVHLSGDNSAVLTTDAQKNTVFAFAREHGIASPEEFGTLLARHFVDSQPTIHHARVHIEEYPWDRHGDHSFARSGAGTRTALIHYDGSRTTVVSGLTDLTVLNTTASEFHGYIKDEYTTLPETKDRVLATAVTAGWRHETADHAALGDFDASYARARGLLIEAFADTYSFSLQQTLYAMGKRVLDGCPETCEVRLALPNKHHFVVDLSPFGLDNDNEVFHAADRPYGLIEGTVLRDDAPDAGRAWE